MSAALVHVDLRAAIRTALVAAVGSLERQWEGREHDPTVGTPFVSESFRPVSSVVRALGSGGTIAHTTNVSFTLHYPANKGVKTIETMAGTLMEAFKPGTSLVYGTVRGTVLSVQRGPLLQDPDWINCAVTLTAVAYTSN